MRTAVASSEPTPLPQLLHIARRDVKRANESTQRANRSLAELERRLGELGIKLEYTNERKEEVPS